MPFKSQDERTKGILALILLSVVIGATGAVVRVLDHYFSLFQQLYLRCFIAAIFVMLLFPRSISWKKLSKISAGEWGLLFFRSLINFTLGAAFWVKGATMAKLANVSLLDALPMTAFLSFLLGMEKFGTRKILMLILSFIGVLVISIKDFSGISGIGLGEILVLISIIFFALRNISRRWHSPLLNDQEISVLMFLIGGLLLLAISLLFRETFNPVIFSLYPLLMLILGGLIMGANLYLNNYGLQRVDPAVAVNIVNLEIIFAGLLGFFIYSEVPTSRELMGGLLIVVSVILMK